MGFMGLLTPIGLLAGLAAVAIVIVHMRRQTPPAAEMPSTRFWVEVADDHVDRRRLRRPPVSLPFILQVSAAVLLTLALARPVIESFFGNESRSSDPEHVIVLLDGSTSMQALSAADSDTSRWDMARDRVANVLDSWRSGDVVSVVVMGARLQTFSASSRLQVRDLTRRLERMATPGGRADLAAALTLSADLVLPDRTNRVLVVSDGAVLVNPAIAARVPALIELDVVGTDGEHQNVSVTSIGARAIVGADDQFRLSYTIASFGPAALRVPYRVQAGGLDIMSDAIDLAPGQARTFEIDLPAGSSDARVALETRDVLIADDSAAIDLSGEGVTSRQVLMISDNPAAMAKALAVLPGASVETVATTTPGIRDLANGYDLVVFDGTTPAPDDVPAVPMIFLNPQPFADRFAVTGVMPAPAVSEVQIGDPLIDGVDFGGVTFGETFVYTLAADERAVVRADGGGASGPVVWTGTLGAAPYVVLGFDLSTSNITQRVAFPVLVARIVETLTASPLLSSSALGEPVDWVAPREALRVALTNPLGTRVELPVTAGDGPAPVSFLDTGVAGVYTIEAVGDGGAVVATGRFLVNAGHPVESNLTTNPDLGSTLIGGPERESTANGGGTLADLWPALVAIALLLVAAEWLASGRRPARRIVPPAGRVTA